MTILKKILHVGLVATTLVGWSGLTTAHAGNSLYGATVMTVSTGQNVNGQNVNEVNFDNGSFTQAGNGIWIERGPEGEPRFEFVEQARDEWSVYLRDSSRGYNVQLDLYTKKIRISDQSGTTLGFYIITEAFTGQHDVPPDSTVGSSISQVTYSCNEGIPLVLTFEDSGNGSFVSWSHDGFTGPKLPQVVSGSGAKYSDGRNTVWTKGNQASVNFDGIEDACTQD